MSISLWGSNHSRQLIAQKATVISGPVVATDPNLEDQVPIQLAAGYEHSMVLTESGDVYWYGSGKAHGGESFSKSNGFKVAGLDHETIVHIAAGAHSSYAVSNSGKVYQW